MTETDTNGLKSRRAHFFTLDDLGLSEYYFAQLFCEEFTKLNPNVTVWDSIGGAFL